MKKFLFLLFLVVFQSSYSQNLEEKVESLIKDHHDSYPDVGLVVSVSKGNEVLFEKAYGYADRSFGIKAKPDHKFRIGSITKQFTAVAILKLMEDGKLNLKDPANKYIDGLDPGISIEHLLTHTSGLKDYAAKPDWFSKVSKQDLEPIEIFRYIENDSLNFKPGSSFEYINTGYHILGLIIEKLNGKEYARYMREEIFVPLKMENTFAHDSKKIIEDLAEGYEVKNGKAYDPEFVHPKQPFAAGNLVSTTGDLRKWYKALFSGRIIKPENLEKALTAYQLNNSERTGYGYGWWLDSIQGLKVVSHGNSYPGYKSEVSYFPETDVLVCVLSNSMPLTNLVKKIGIVSNSLDFKKKEFLSLNEEELIAFEASYKSGNEHWDFEVIDGKLHYSINNDSRYEVKPVEKELFYSLDWDVSLEFRELENGQYQQMILHWNDSEIPYQLVTDKEDS